MTDDGNGKKDAKGAPGAPDADAQAWERLISGRGPSLDLQRRVARHEFIPQADIRRVKMDQAIRKLGRRIRKTTPWILDHDAAVLRAWCELELLAQAAFDKIVREGPFNPEGDDLRNLVQTYERLRKSQLVFARELGLTPSARAAVGGRRMPDLASLMSATDVDYEDVDGPKE